MHPLLEKAEWLLAGMFASIFHAVPINVAKSGPTGRRIETRRTVPASSRIVVRCVAVLVQLMSMFRVPRGGEDSDMAKKIKGNGTLGPVRSEREFVKLSNHCIGRTLARDLSQQVMVPTGRGVAMESVPVTWRWMLDMGARNIGTDLNVCYHTDAVRRNLFDGLSRIGLHVDASDFFSSF